MRKKPLLPVRNDPNAQKPTKKVTRDALMR
jgi:hypothetical protein